MVDLHVDFNRFKSKAKGKKLEEARKSYVNFCNRVYDNNHKLLSDYVNAKTKVLIDYNCEHEPHWITPDNYQQGQWCPKCKGKCPKQAEDDFMKRLNGNNHKLLSEYKNIKKKVLIDFNCGHEPHWITPSHYRQGKGCPRCAGISKKQAEEELLNMIDENNHKLLSNYINNNTKILIDFNCGHDAAWVTPYHYKNGSECPRCYGRSGQSKDDFLHLLKENNHILNSEYIRESEKVLIDFNCGHKAHWISPNNYKQGGRCPLCRNKGESALYKLLTSMGFKVETNKKYDGLKDKLPLAYDFYLPEHNLLIELDGDHHRKEVVYSKKEATDKERDVFKVDSFLRLHDRIYKDDLKTKFAQNNGIPLLRIEYNKGRVELDKWKELVLDKVRKIELDSIL